MSSAMDEITTEYTRYKDRKMSLKNWHELGKLDKKYWYGLIPQQCIPAPMNWMDRIPQEWWFLPQADFDTWLIEAFNSSELNRAISYDYTYGLLTTLEDYATGGSVRRHEGGNLILIIEGQQRSGKSDLGKTIAKEYKFIQKDIRKKNVKIWVALTFEQFENAVQNMGDNDICIADEIDKWTGLGAQNRLSGLLNYIQRIAMTGKSFIFVAPEVRVKAIRDAGYLLLSTFGICFEYEMNRFLVKKKSQHSDRYIYLGTAALQRNWWFGEFPEYQKQKRESIRLTELRMGLNLGWDMKKLVHSSELIWNWTFKHDELFEENEEIFYAKSINEALWRGFAGKAVIWAEEMLKDPDGIPEEDLAYYKDLMKHAEIESLGTEYAKLVAAQLVGRHKLAKFKYELTKKKNKDAPEVGTIPQMPDHRSKSTLKDLPEFDMRFRLFAKVPLDYDYIELMCQPDTVETAIKAKYQKKLTAEDLRVVDKLPLMVRAWRMYLYTRSYSKAQDALLSEESIKIAHQTVSNYEKTIAGTIEGNMDEIAFSKRFPDFKWLGGSGGDIAGLRDHEHITDEYTVSKKARSDPTYTPRAKHLSAQEQKDVYDGRCVFLVLTDLKNMCFKYWAVQKTDGKTEDEIEEIFDEFIDDGIELFSLRSYVESEPESSDHSVST